MKFLADSRLRRLAAAAALVALAAPALAGPDIVRHEVDVTLDPAAGTVTFQDVAVIRRDDGGLLLFDLDARWTVTSATLDGRDVTIDSDEQGPGRRLQVPPGTEPEARLVLRYAGTAAVRVPDAGLFGVGDGAWCPWDGSADHMEIRLRVPRAYVAVTGGARLERTVSDSHEVTRWQTRFALTSAPWIRAVEMSYFERRVGDAVLSAHLGVHANRADDVLDLLQRAIEVCTDLLGASPRDRFDIVERSWHGGLPGLVEIDADRLEVALGTASPLMLELTETREDEVARRLARTWWGRVAEPHSGLDPSGGLVEYCFDQLRTERAEPGAAIARRAQINELLSGDEPREFGGITRGDADTPSMQRARARGSMVFHALRREIGLEAFQNTLRRAAAKPSNVPLDWAGWQTVFEEGSGRNLQAFFEQWVDRRGAPRLVLSEVRVATRGGRTRVTGTVLQALGRTELPWRLSVPVVVEMLDGRETTEVLMDGEEATFSVLVPSLPLRVSVDPEHHVLRRLSAAELPGDDGSPGVSLTSKRVLPDVKAAADPERVKRIFELLTEGDVEGRRAGTPAEAAAQRIVENALREAGASVRSQPFSFTVLGSHDASGLSVSGRSVAGVLPVVPSPATTETGVTATGIATDPSDDLAGRALIVDLPATSGDPRGFVRSLAELAQSGGAVALLVRIPADDPADLRRLCATPETLADGLYKLEDPLLVAARAASDGRDHEPLALPTLAVPADAVLDGPLVVRVAWNEAVVESANVVARLTGSGSRAGGPILLAARLDARSSGFPGAGQAAGLAAVVEAAHILVAHQRLLSRDVVIVAFGAEEWGNRGSRAFFSALATGKEDATLPAAALLAGSIGHAARVDVSLFGAADEPRLARVGSVALEEAALEVGMETAPWHAVAARAVFTRAGVPCVMLRSDDEDHGSPFDMPDNVDAAKTSRVARALALAALALSAGY